MCGKESLMSVPKHKRNTSPLEVYEQAVKLRAVLTTLVLKDFGVKDHVKNVKVISDSLTLEQLNELESLDVKIKLEYPEWFLVKERDTILNLTTTLAHSILDANKIFITTKTEYELRRSLIDRAIYTCHSLLLELRFISDMLHIPLSKMEPYIRTLDYEIVLLKEWRKSDNRFLKDIQ